MSARNGFSTFLCTAQTTLFRQDYVYQFGDVPYDLTSIACTANDQKGWLTNMD
jgi:hypothetical protein